MLIAESIRTKISNKLHPRYLNIVNESALHHGTKGNETHFKIEIVSDEFENLKRLERHRLVQSILKDEINLIKAFSLHPFTLTEWEKKEKVFERSPRCRGSHDSST